MAVLMLIITAVGFAPTYYLRSQFNGPLLTPVLSIHGVFCSLWVLMFLIQTSLIAASQVRFHRRLGLFSVILAGLLVASSLLVLYEVIQTSDDLAGSMSWIAPLVWGNLVILTAFSLFVGLGVVFRRRPDTHNRLMLLATVSMMGQPLVRIGQIPAIKISDVRITNDAIYGFGGLAVLLLIILAHDVYRRGRPHRVVAIGAPAFLGGMVLITNLVANTSAGRAFILWFE